MGDSSTQEEVELQFTDKDKLEIENSIAAHIRWRKTYKASVEGRLLMIATCPTTEVVEYLRIEWAKYERKCRDIEIGTSILMGKDPTVVERIMVGVEEQPKKAEDPARRKEIERLMKVKCYRCGENHQTDQCLQKGSSLKCTSVAERDTSPKHTTLTCSRSQDPSRQTPSRHRQSLANWLPPRSRQPSPPGW